MSGTKMGALLDTWRLGRFVSVGIAGSVVDLSIGAILLFRTSMPPELVKVIGAECAVLLMFVINDRWTYPQHRSTRFRQGIRRLVKSNLVRSGGIAVQVVIVYVLIRLAITVEIGSVDLWPIAVMGIAIVCGGVVNYVGETLLTWRVHA